MTTLDLNNLPEVDLIDELSGNITQGASSGLQFINHAFVNDVYSPELNALYNLRYAQTKAAVDEAHDKGAWSTFIFLHARPYRMQALLQLVTEHDMKPAHEKAIALIVENLHDVYIDAEGTHINREIWQSLFERLPPEHRNTETLPAKVILYRGTDAPAGKDRGFSWTLNKEKAKWFAERWCRENKPGRVRAIEVLREGIMLYTDERSEQECVYFGPLA